LPSARRRKRVRLHYIFEGEGQPVVLIHGLNEGSALQGFWDRIPERQGRKTPSVCARSLGKLALTEAELKAINIPVEIVVGDQDPTSRLYVMRSDKYAPIGRWF